MYEPEAEVRQKSMSRTLEKLEKKERRMTRVLRKRRKGVEAKTSKERKRYNEGSIDTKSIPNPRARSTKKRMAATSNRHESNYRRQGISPRMWIGYDHRLKGIYNSCRERRRLR
ncbi:hypothetical protein L5515_016190 [Caenorhabditis briggsae]|uniref:Uncharacterized protein n=1 Tax=Caenorhabditis briggsae TaxID=6238 RepID=A0AAE9JNZ7_CAEBR|nr:hypothetical protein L5515_016190 [Caenorhabditis briggsae]